MSETVEKTTLLTAGALLLSSGIEALKNNVYIGVFMILLGIGCIAFRELRKEVYH